LRAFLVALIATAFEVWLRGGFAPHAILLWAHSCALCQWALYGLIGLLLIEVPFSAGSIRMRRWRRFVRALNDPLMRPLRRIVPLIGTIDLSPLVAIVLLQIAIQLVAVVFSSFV
jgi:YggT family protein